VRLIGYCERCHRVRYVRVGTSAIHLLTAKRVAVGVCAECEAADEKAKR
jgi:hypothetical protein